jgi:uroporphyrinogen-III decarboxylase
LQVETFPSIDGIFLLDDIIGFIGEAEFRKFSLPYFKEFFKVDISVKEKSKVILSCGGGMPPAVPTENIKAFLEAVVSTK